MRFLLYCFLAVLLSPTGAFVVRNPPATTSLSAMKRPLLDQLATTLFNLENARVQASSEIDEQGRKGEPMAWSEKDSWANRFSEIMATAGYGLKQWVADFVAGDYDREQVEKIIQDLVQTNEIAMFSFTTCPFCRRAKDYLDQRGLAYTALEVDQHPMGNQIRAVLGQQTKRTSMPAIFIRQTFIGGCNDGPGLLTLAESGELERLLAPEK